MAEFLSKFSAEELCEILFVGSGMLLAIVIAIGGFWYKSYKAGIAANLKQDMLNRGMSAEEIKTVLDAGSKPPAIQIAWKKK